MRWEELNSPFEPERKEDPYVTGNGHEDFGSDAVKYKFSSYNELAVLDEFKKLFRTDKKVWKKVKTK